ncbi:MAG TPA: DHH family phosphoesterase [Longimicrobiales bacterium]|nr:DHH family phosphoesterase [Longimicrobiales bacterium]
MTSLQETRQNTPALLLLIDESDEIDATVRSGERQVLRWSPDGDADACFTGDVTDEATYRCARDSRSVSAVIDLADDARAEAALRALRSARPDAAVLVLSQALDHAPGDGTLTRAGTLRDVVRLDLDEELRRLEAQRRAWCLRQFATGAAAVPVLIHPDPDPDAISSAFALQRLLGDVAPAPIVTLGAIRRPENRRMVDLLQLDVQPISPGEVGSLERLVTVDMQPAGLLGEGAAVAVIDHHPPEPGYRAEYLDVRSEFGAAATMLTEYLRAAGGALIDERLATALLHGIRTDTDLLTRGVSAADVEAYAFLQERADPALLRRIERPQLPAAAARRLGQALSGLHVAGGLVVVHAGQLAAEWAHLLPELADYCLDIEEATLAVASAVVADELVLTLRYSGRDEGGAGVVARRIADGGGKGGGHAAMARAVLPCARAEQLLGGPADAAALLRYLAGVPEVEALSRRS